jgi:dTDP-4-dehydrorhamnose reductase
VPYVEDDVPNPLNVHGRCKPASERAIQAFGTNYPILHTSREYGVTGKNFLVTIRQLAAERDEIKIVNDQTGARTWSRDFASSTGAILARIASSVSASERR